MSELKMSQEILSFIKGKTLEDIFLSAEAQKIILNWPWEYKRSLLSHFSGRHTTKVIYDTERGIDGGVFEGAVEIWNVAEYSPWVIQSPVTLVFGNLLIEEENKNAVLQIKNKAHLFLTGDLIVGNLELLEGEIYCLGKVEVKSTLSVEKNSFITAKQVSYKNSHMNGVVKEEGK